MKQKLLGLVRRDNRGLALISVLGLVTLATILILSLFSVGQTEHKSARIYAAGASAKQFADNAVNIVIGQVQAAAEGTGATGTGRTIWASQPGSVRVYGQNGSFLVGRKLYSDDVMVSTTAGIGGEQAFGKDSTQDPNFSNWNDHPDQYADLNAPVVTSVDGERHIYFPIIDPRASIGTTDRGPVDGFTFYESPGSDSGYSDGGSKIQNVVKSAALEGINMRLPMPVQWLYFLRDGNTGVVDGQGEWASAGVAPSADNPIIGRVGFWTDDETCKVNINTAGEPSPWNIPTVYFQRDALWADAPPSFNEFQRYPGHPATVALSSVFVPPSGIYHPDTYPVPSSKAMSFKNAIYDLAPKLASGGSQDGTKVFAPDELKADTSAQVLLTAAYKEYLFANVDEIHFDSGMKGKERNVNKLSWGTGSPLISPENLEHTRAFLTSNSRGSELNMFGLPRVAIWPVPERSRGKAFRTGFDDSIALCGTLGSDPTNTYFFERLDSHSSLADIGRDSGGKQGLVRNAKLMNYLYAMVNQVMPGGASFTTKYTANGGRNDAAQILVEIFDYIRTTNLYDSFLAESYNTAKDLRDGDPNVAGSKVNDIVIFDEVAKLKPFYTYTEPRFSTTRTRDNIAGLTSTMPEYKAYTKQEPVATGMYPGHGQVRPSDWLAGTVSQLEYKGFGRFPTVSEIALHFICTGDGLNDKGSYTVTTPDGSVIRSGGKTAEMIDTQALNVRLIRTERVGGGLPKRLYWYSNIPPFPSMKTFESWGCDPGSLGSGGPYDPARHPGWDSANWNSTLAFNNSAGGGVPLKEDEKRVQAALTVETFVPALGWTKIAPEFSVTLDANALASIQVESVVDGITKYVPLFSSTESRVWKSSGVHMGGTRGLTYTGINPVGGSYGTEAFMTGRTVKALGTMPADSGYVGDTGTPNGNLKDFNFVSSCFTVKRQKGADPKKPAAIQFKGGSPIELKIYASHDFAGGGANSKKNSIPVQTIRFQIPDGTMPVPHLVVYSSERREYIDSGGGRIEAKAINACRWWTFNANGAINRWTGRGNLNPGNPWGGGVVNNSTPDEISRRDTYGRMHAGTTSGYANVETRPAGKAGKVPYDRSLIYGYANTANFSGVKANNKVDLDDIDEYEPGNLLSQTDSMGTVGYYGTDSIKSIVPQHGDYRILAGMKVVPESMWMRHPVWAKEESELFAHSLNSFSSGAELGFDLGGTSAGRGGTSQDEEADNRLIQGAWYPQTKIPDSPNNAVASKWSTQYRDFDNGPGNVRDGAYINKADDGNLSVMDLFYGNKGRGIHTVRNAYFSDTQLQLPSKAAFFTPNRMISSPGVFGSLSTGVYGSQPAGEPNKGLYGVPWRTLLFRADINGHVGAAQWSGGVSPADHHFLDLFWMPVVEPYAISNNFSTAGKVNLNWQLLPFTHIRRETALYAALKGEILTAISQNNAFVAGNPRKSSGTPSRTNRVAYKDFKTGTGDYPQSYWSEADNFKWERRINIPETLRQLEERFVYNPSVYGAAQGLLRTASQLCELHLIPEKFGNDGLNANGIAYNPATRTGKMRAFWDANRLTGDNTRERPYANIYQKVTTKSNTYRVHFLAQSLLKAKSLAATTVDTTRDTVTSTYRGSALVERYLDSGSADSPRALPNFASLILPGA
ncbi:MAG: Verru_Chthon cassette protein A, partial [Fimbriimonadaceae bacterium]